MSNDTAQLIEWYGAAPTIVVVPDLKAVDFTRLVRRELDLTYINPDFERWDYHTDRSGKVIPGRGLKLESIVWKPELTKGEGIRSEEARSHLWDHGRFFGHTAAFTQWRRTSGSQGFHVSILDESACWLDVHGRWFPNSVFCEGSRRIGFGDFLRLWSDWWSFVGFRLAQG